VGKDIQEVEIQATEPRDVHEREYGVEGGVGESRDQFQWAHWQLEAVQACNRFKFCRFYHRSHYDSHSILVDHLRWLDDSIHRGLLPSIVCYFIAGSSDHASWLILIPVTFNAVLSFP